MSIICSIFGHKWNGCKCSRKNCSGKRDEEHQYGEPNSSCIAICEGCGKELTSHTWEVSDGRCSRCEKYFEETLDEGTIQILNALRFTLYDNPVKEQRELIKAVLLQQEYGNLNANTADLLSLSSQFLYLSTDFEGYSASVKLFSDDREKLKNKPGTPPFTYKETILLLYCATKHIEDSVIIITKSSEKLKQDAQSYNPNYDFMGNQRKLLEERQAKIQAFAKECDLIIKFINLISNITGMKNTSLEAITALYTLIGMSENNLK